MSNRKKRKATNHDSATRITKKPVDETKHACGNCGKLWDDSQLDEITHGFWERVQPGELMPSGECPNCHALCHPVVNALTPYENVLKSLLDTVLATGGLVKFPNGMIAPEADHDWIDLGDAIVQARKLIPTKMTITKADE